MLHAPGGVKDENQPIVLSIKHKVVDQSRTDLNYSLEMSENRRDWCLCKAEDSLIEGSESTMTGNCSHTINLPGIAKTRLLGNRSRSKLTAKLGFSNE